MYSKETITKAVEKLQEKIAFYESMRAEEIKMCISDGNKKIGKTLNVSLAPIITCHNCRECMKYCYDVKAVMAYPSCLDARARNTALFMKDRGDFFGRLHKRMRGRKARKALRFHVSGEIVDSDHLDRIIDTARMFPDWTIWTYTKMYWVVNQYVDSHGGSIAAAIPSNLHVMFSEWKGLPMDNPHGFPVFRCAFDESDKVGHHCPGNCDICLAHKRGCVVGESSWVDNH